MTFDIDNALREIDQHRHVGGPLLVETTKLAEQIAAGFRRDFDGTLDLDTCGRALVIAAASLVPLCDPEIPGTVLVNMIGIAGAILVEGGAR